MKEKYFSSKYLILIIIILTCLFIFSTTSLALIPGDFGSANNGPPDGVVDFEDLMIFAPAYNSTPSDSNWKEVCDIAGEGGVLEPDGKIDFEDLMVFAQHYGERERATWTVAVYIDGDNNLDDCAWDDLTELESVSATDEIKIVTQLDPRYRCSGNYRYSITVADQGTSYP